MDILACSLAPVRLEKTMLAKRAKTATTTVSYTHLFLPAETADSSYTKASEFFKYIFANVVFPDPGGPQRINDVALPFSIISLNGFPSPTKCSCPTKSLRSSGLISVSYTHLNDALINAPVL